MRLIVLAVMLTVAQGCGGATISDPQPAFPLPAPGAIECAGPGYVLRCGDFGDADATDAANAKQGFLLANAVLNSDCFSTQLNAYDLDPSESPDKTTLLTALRSATTLRISFFNGSWWQNKVAKTIGYDVESMPDTVHMNRNFVTNATMVATNLLHEAAHARGYRHRSARDYRSVPYAMNKIFSACVADPTVATKVHSLVPGQPKMEGAFLASVAGPQLQEDVRSAGRLQIPRSSVTADARAERAQSICAAVQSAGRRKISPSSDVEKAAQELLRGSMPYEDKISNGLFILREGLREGLTDQPSLKALQPTKKDAPAPLPAHQAKVAAGALILKDALASLQDACVTRAENKKLTVAALNAFDDLKKLDGVSASLMVLDKASFGVETLDAHQSAEFVAKLDLGKIGDGTVKQPAQADLGSLQSQVVDGLAEFVVTRAKAEASLYAQDVLAKQLCTTETRKYLANTCVALEKLDTRLSLQAVGTYLQTAAFRDVQALPEALILAKAGPDRSPSQQAMALGLAFYRNAFAGRQPLEVAWSMREAACPQRNGGRLWLGSLDGAACIAADIVTAIERRGAGAKINDDLMKTILSDLRILLKQDLGKDFELIDSQIERTAKELDALVPEVLAVERAAQELVTSSTSASGEQKASTMIAARLALTSQALAAFARGARLVGCVEDAAKCDSEPGLSDLDAAVETADFASKFFSDDAAGAATAALALLRRSDIALPPAIEKTLPLVVEIASAKSSQDVASALEVAAAPAGSYKAKYERREIAVNAFLGGSVAGEVLPNTNAVGVAGLFAPVGVHATLPLSSMFHGGVFVSVVDLGALTETRLTTTNDVASKTNVGFAQVFSPGMFLTLGMFGSPFVLGAGAAVTPQLRSKNLLDAQGNQIPDAQGNPSTGSDVASVRVGGFLAFDLTILPL
jgi:hypothetical protein